jgi:hypothetical protein
MADTTITATDVVNSFGSYYIDGGQGVKDLLTRPFFPFGTREAMTNIPSESTQLRFSDVTVGKILQPWQKAYTPAGSVTFKPVTIDLKPVKIDLQLGPDDLKTLFYSWLGFLSSTNTDRTTWPFVKWLIEYYALNQKDEDIEMDLIYKGDEDAVVPGTPGDPADVQDGIKKIINDNIGTMTQINTGAIAADPKDFVTQVEEFVKEIPKRYWSKPMQINVNPDLEVKFKEGMQQKYNTYYAQVTDIATVRNFANFSIKGRMSMDGSDKIWATPKPNLVFAAKGFSNSNGFEIEKVDRTVKIYTDWHMGWGFLQKDLVFTNDVDM